MDIRTVGFIGLGNVGAKLAGSLLASGVVLFVHDLDPDKAKGLVARGATFLPRVEQLIPLCDCVITCLPSPQISASVLAGDNGLLNHLKPHSLWIEMSTTDQSEVLRLGEIAATNNVEALDCPVSGGCHRAETGNISIFVGGERKTFDRAMPLLAAMGRHILHTGGLGSASVLKVVTNYLATANLVSLSEALVTCDQAGMDMRTAFQAIKISSGNSFVHETESQVILNGSRNINFTMDLVLKDIGLFQAVADRAGVSLELSPLLMSIFKDGIDRYGGREWSPNIIKRLEDEVGKTVKASGFPDQIVDDEPSQAGSEFTGVV